TVLGLMQLYRWENKLELKGLPVIIPLLFSCAILTKGLVGIVLPLFVYLVYLLILRKYTFLKIAKTLVYTGISSLFIPLIWYAAAYQQGGEGFLNALFAADFGQFFHTERSFTGYHPASLLSGFIPWTLLFVFSLFGAKWCMPRKSFGQILKDAWHWFLSIEKMKRFSLVVAVCIILFYSIPTSKNSAYLLSAYPFISILLAQYFIYITENRSKVTRVFAYILTTIASITFIAGILTMTQAIDFHSLASGYTTNEALLLTIGNITNTLASGGFANWVIMCLILLSIATVIYQTTRKINIKILYSTILMTFSLNLFVDSIVMQGCG
ncbi:dolichyl-phosphate-mannose--protein mannosyltransferase, partial [Bacteroides sp. OttesenSCG-928-D19]|nr:dolichyl-phosphate-mannose--protein mannosyltransferase [Bacteroides sp. OttesenSCG-928-D19]